MNYNYPKEIKENLDIVCNDLNKFSASNEMITTFLGKPEGGMVLIPWNTLIHLIHSLLQPIAVKEKLAGIKKENE